jgi:small conductance mechanosensitive channel
MDFIKHNWIQLIYVAVIMLAALFIHILIKAALRKTIDKDTSSSSEPSNLKLVMSIINWLLVMASLFLSFHIFQPIRGILNTEFRYVIIIAAIIIITIFIQRLVRFGLGRYLRSSAENLNVDPTAFNFIKNALNAIILIIAALLIIYTIPSLRALGATMLASAGIVAAIAAFASQHAMANIVSGVFIVIFKPFRVEDIVKIGTDVLGKIEDITLRHTIIRNFENRRVIIPNSTISSATIVNFNLVDDKICVYLEIGISYDSDIDKAMHIMKTLAENHPMCIDNRDEQKKAENKPIVVTRVLSLGDWSVNLRAWVWAMNSDDAFVMKCDLLKQVKEEFDRQGIEIPFPHHTLAYKTDILKERKETLTNLDKQQQFPSSEGLPKSGDFSTDA